MIEMKKILCICVLIWIGAEFISAQHHSHHHGHGHSHDHHHHDHEHPPEAPSFRYSREANEPRQSEPSSSQHKKHTHQQRSSKKARSFEDTAYLWGRALGSTVLISIAPFLILFFIPIESRSGHESFLKVLLSFASGGLLGDAFLHLIPHALVPHDAEDDHSHSHAHSHESHGHDNSVGLWVLAGILTFLVVEKLVRMIKGSHSHAHSHEKKSEEDSQLKGRCDGETSGGEDVKTVSGVVQRKKEKLNEIPQAGETVQSAADKKSDIKVSAYLNLAADFTHNFTDGLAIGASYIAGNTAGLISTVTILLHEVPHEIGDFAILIQAGYSKRKAMLMQLVTAVGCLSGTLCSLVVEGMTSSASSWVLPFTAGGFIYIATVSVIPELLENTSLRQSAKEVLALIAGVSMMAVLTQFE